MRVSLSNFRRWSFTCLLAICRWYGRRFRRPWRSTHSKLCHSISQLMHWILPGLHTGQFIRLLPYPLCCFGRKADVAIPIRYVYVNSFTIRPSISPIWCLNSLFRNVIIIIYDIMALIISLQQRRSSMRLMTLLSFICSVNVWRATPSPQRGRRLSRRRR